MQNNEKTPENVVKQPQKRVSAENSVKRVKKGALCLKTSKNRREKDLPGRNGLYGRKTAVNDRKHV